MAEINTDSYPKPTAPPSLISQVQGYQQLESNKLGIDRQKLENTDKALGFMTRAMGSIGPNATKDQFAAVGQNAVQMGLVPKEMLGTYMQRLQAAPTAGDFYNEFMNAAADHQSQLDYHLGRPGTVETGQTIQPVTTSQKPGFGVRSTGLPIQVQPPPTQPGFDQNGNPAFRGAQPPQVAPGAVAAPPPAPGARLPVASPVATTGPTGPTVRRPDLDSPTPGPVPPELIRGQSSNFGGNVMGATIEPTKFAPGPPANFEVGQKLYAQDQASTTAKATALKPLEEAYSLAKEVDKTGIGSENLNKIRAGLVNAGLVKADEKNPAVLYQMLNKNLAQFVDKSGSRSDADLAIKESSNANAKTQLQPALLHMVQKIIGREKVEMARPGAFEGQNYQDYGKHSASFPTSQDERAYTIDKMPPAEAKQLYLDMRQKALSGNPEGIKFLKSLSIAKKQGLINGLNQ